MSQETLRQCGRETIPPVSQQEDRDHDPRERRMRSCHSRKDEDHAERAVYYTTQAKDDPVRYIHNNVGYNYRLTNIQAALGVAQLESLPS